MAQNVGKLGLMSLAALVPVLVLLGVATNGGGIGIGATSKAVDSVAKAGRRLTTTSASSTSETIEERDFATQLEMTVCLSEDHNTDSATVTTDQFKSAMMSVYKLEDADLVNVDDAVNKCTVDGWERRLSVYNVADDTGSAADIASAQVDQAYPEPNTQTFFNETATYINELDPELTFPGSDFVLVSLGFLVIWLDADGDVLDGQTSTTSKDVVNIAGTDVWWPWWAWLIYAGVVVCCICPMLFFFFKWRRDKEAEMEPYAGASGKGTGAHPPSTSSNPYSGNYVGSYPLTEEHKSGK